MYRTLVHLRNKNIYKVNTNKTTILMVFKSTTLISYYRWRCFVETQLPLRSPYKWLSNRNPLSSIHWCPWIYHEGQFPCGFPLYYLLYSIHVFDFPWAVVCYYVLSPVLGFFYQYAEINTVLCSMIINKSKHRRWNDGVEGESLRRQ